MSVQGRRGSDSNRRSAECKGDMGSGRSIPIKQVRNRMQMLNRNKYDAFHDLLPRTSQQQSLDIKCVKAVPSCRAMMCCDPPYWPDE